MKRTLDCMAAAAGLVFLSPLLLVFVVLIRATSQGPAVYRQQRVGKGARPFTMFKFRSMRQGADKSGYSTATGDPRITPLGQFMRKTSIDELPQLLNVLKGDMSLVGPRPYVPAQEVDYAPEEWRERHSVRPGITGLAQVRVRSAGTREQVLAYDLEYVRTHNLKLDVSLLFGTLGTLLSGPSN